MSSEPGGDSAPGRFLGENSSYSVRCSPPEPTRGLDTFVALAIIGMLSAAAGAYYYLRIVVLMYFGKPKDPIEVTGGWPIAAAMSVCVFLTVYFGVNSAPLSSRAHAAGSKRALAHPQPSGTSVAVR